MTAIVKANIPEHLSHIRRLWWEYLQWANGNVKENFGVTFDIRSMLEDDIDNIKKFTSPCGRLLLADHDQTMVGIASMRGIEPGVGEIKRMYVRPNYRRLGIGQALLYSLIEEAHIMAFRKIYLDSARFMLAAHQLYRSMGFIEVDPYKESEIPEDFRSNWIFMEKVL